MKTMLNRREEIEAVKELGEKIGYGNMMDIASALWAIKESKIDGQIKPIHVPTVESYLTKTGVKESYKALQFRVDEIQKYGF